LLYHDIDVTVSIIQEDDVKSVKASMKFKKKRCCVFSCQIHKT